MKNVSGAHLRVLRESIRVGLYLTVETRLLQGAAAAGVRVESDNSAVVGSGGQSNFSNVVVSDMIGSGAQSDTRLTTQDEHY